MSEGVEKKIELLKKEDVQQVVQEYSRFLSARGDLMKLATVFILGTAFEKLVKTLVDDMFMPLVNFLVSSTGSPWQTIVWSPVQGLTLNVGSAISALVNFLLLSLVLFVIIKWMGKLDDVVPPPSPPSS